MLQRREFLIAGATLPVAVALAPTRLTASPYVRPVADGVIAVVDGHFPASVLFARRIHLMGGSVRHIAGDITPVWMAFLGERALREATFVGLTTPQSLFALHLMMQSEGLRLIHRVAQTAHAETAGWGGRAASAALDAIARQQVQGPFESCPSMCAENNSDLVSWTLAPIGRYPSVSA